MSYPPQLEFFPENLMGLQAACRDCPLEEACREMAISNDLYSNLGMEIQESTYDDLSARDKFRAWNLMLVPHGVTPAINSEKCKGPKRNYLVLGKKVCRGKIEWLHPDETGRMEDIFPDRMRI